MVLKTVLEAVNQRLDQKRLVEERPKIAERRERLKVQLRAWLKELRKRSAAAKEKRGEKMGGGRWASWMMSVMALIFSRAGSFDDRGTGQADRVNRLRCACGVNCAARHTVNDSHAEGLVDISRGSFPIG